MLFNNGGAGETALFDTVSVKETTGGSVIARGLFSGGGTTGIKVTTAGNVGIGTTGPALKLDVSGAIRATGATGGSSGVGVEIGYEPGGFGAIVGYDRTGLAYKQIRINDLLNVGLGSSGNVGIGTTGPLQKLQVAGDINIESGSGVRINNTATSGYYLRGDGTRFVSSAIQAGDLPAIVAAGGWTDDGTVVRLTTSTDQVGIGYTTMSAGTGLAISGNVGIGTTGPGASWSVNGGANGDGIFLVANGSAGAGPVLDFRNSRRQFCYKGALVTTGDPDV